MLLCPDTFFIHDWTIHIPSVPALTLWGGCQSREIMWHGRQGKGRWGGVSVSPLRRSWPPDSWDSTKHWVNIYLSYIFIGKEREQKRGRAGWRAPMLPLQHDREPGERRHICHRINFPLPGTWVSGAAPVHGTHTLMTSDRIQKLPIVGWWTPVKSFHTEIHTTPTESDVQPLLKIDNDTTTDVCVWFLWALVYLIYSLPLYS